jgi:hypothetical protein
VLAVAEKAGAPPALADADGADQGIQNHASNAVTPVKTDAAIAVKNPSW